MVQVVVGSTADNYHFLPAIHVSQMVQCLARARIWQRVCHLSFSCEQWLGPVSPPHTHADILEGTCRNIRSLWSQIQAKTQSSDRGSQPLCTHQQELSVPHHWPEIRALHMQ